MLYLQHKLFRPAEYGRMNTVHYRCDRTVFGLDHYHPPWEVSCGGYVYDVCGA
jgi:hypothetical protein